jgi:hypothetical protein
LSGLGECRDAVERANGILENRYRFWTYDEYELPEDLKWNEDPAASANWTYYLLSFEFLWILNEAYRETGNAAYLEKARILIEDFASKNLDPGRSPSELSWFDHPVSNRLVYLVDYWFLYHGAGTPSPGFTYLMLELMWRHARFLMSPSNYSSRTNHGLFSCLALERFALAFPEMAEADDYLEFSTSRFRKQLEDNFDKDGIHREYSPWYQIWVAGLLKVYMEDCRRNGVQLPLVCGGSVDRIVRACGYFFHPDGTIALFGDSDIHPTEKMMDLALDSCPALRFVSTGGLEGERPAPCSAGLTGSNIYIMRSGWGEKRPCVDESCLMAFFTPPAVNHDHQDLMGFEMYSGGTKWITDLGRYNYNYQAEERKFIVSAEAHNSIVPRVYMTPADSSGTGSGAEEESGALPAPRTYIPPDKLEAMLKEISREPDPRQREHSYRKLLESERGDSAMRIRFLLAFVLAEDLGDDEAAASELNEIIRVDADRKYVAYAKRYLATLEITGDLEEEKVPVKIGTSSGEGPAIITWRSSDGFDYLEGYMRYEEGSFCHRRAILFIKPHYFLVVDRLTAEGAADFRQYFHFPPDVSVTDGGGFEYILESRQGGSCIMKALMMPRSAETEIIRGRTMPEYQGWYSGCFGSFVPASALETRATFSREAVVVFLFVPTGRMDPATVSISIDEKDFSGTTNEVTGSIHLEIDTPHRKTAIDYRPSARFLDRIGYDGWAPLIDVVEESK